MKKIIILTTFVIALFALTACSSEQSVGVDEKKDVVSGDFRRPDFGQPQKTPDIQGLVSSIVGNEVTILKIERGQVNDGGADEEIQNEDDNSQSGKTITMGTGSMPGMDRGGRGIGGNRPDMDEDMQDQMLEKIKAMSTEEETVLIPVGIQMLKPNTVSDTEEESILEASLEDIEKNTMLQIWLNEDITDRKVAEFVLIMK